MVKTIILKRMGIKTSCNNFLNMKIQNITSYVFKGIRGKALKIQIVQTPK